MALFKRRFKTGELELHVEPETWVRRLARVGYALDSLLDELRDVSIIFEGDEADRGEVISLLSYRQSTFVAGWTSVMYRLGKDRDSILLADEFGGSPRTREVPRSDWFKQMTGVGMLMDELAGKLLSPSIVVLPSGMVVNALTAGMDWPPVYTLRSYAFSNDQISEAFARDLSSSELAAGQRERSR